MALTKYHQKRNFKQTPEPEGKVARNNSQPLRFVVQKHEASHLHYDFRLELDGVLKSWAVPKGPSLNPKDKHLAMMVEDHPLDYRNFEGTIPEGNYGAGTVMVWDEGTYHIPTSANPVVSADVVRQELERGNVKIYLEGKKLRGEFALVKLKKAEDNAWLLIKHNDEFAGHKIPNEDLSVITGRTMQQISKGEVAKTKSPIKLDLPTDTKGPMPHNIKPMLASLVEESFDDPNWLFEVKWDGYRAIAEVQDGKVNLYSRNNLSFNTDYPPVVQELSKFPDMILDGEVVVVNDQGVSDFQLLQNYRRYGTGRLVYYVFDLLYYDGHDLRSLPLIERKQLLSQVLPQSHIVKYSDHVEGSGLDFLEAARAQNLEGIVAKNAQSKYQMGLRNTDWLKIKILHRQEVVVGGYTTPEGQRQEFGALLGGVYERKKLCYVGLVGGGFTDRELRELKARLDHYAVDDSPFSDLDRLPNLAAWCTPKMVVEVKFSGWTEEGYMRQPVFMGIREDKNPLDVKREKPKKVTVKKSKVKPAKKQKQMS
jgi:bifunctional non-homologous end joining protein LigD